MTETIITSLILFASSFSMTVLLGFQSQVVRLGHKWMSFALSTCIGFSQIFAFKLVPDANTIELFVWVIGGALGIVSSITVHDWYIKYHNINDTRGVTE